MNEITIKLISMHTYNLYIYIIDTVCIRINIYIYIYYIFHLYKLLLFKMY